MNSIQCIYSDRALEENFDYLYDKDYDFDQVEIINNISANQTVYNDESVLDSSERTLLQLSIPEDSMIQTD